MKVHDAATGAVQSEFQVSRDQVKIAAFSRDGRRIGFLSFDDASVAIWDLDPAPRLKATIQPDPRATRNVTMAVGGVIAGLSAPDVARGQRFLAADATYICFLDGDRVMMCDPVAASLWDLNGPTVMTRFELPTKSSPGVSFFSGGTQLSAAAGDTIAAMGDGELSLWDIPRTSDVQIVRARLDFSDPAAFRRVRHGTQSPKTVDLGANHGFRSFLLSPNGKWLVTHNGEQIRVWDVVTGTKLAERSLADASPEGLSSSSDSTILCMSGENRRVWRLPGLEPTPAIPQIPRSGYVGISTEGRQVYVLEGGAAGVFSREAPSAIVPLDPPAEWGISPNSFGGYQIAASGPVVFRAISRIYQWGDGPAARTDIGAALSRAFLLTPSGATAIDLDHGILSTTLTTYNLKQKRKLHSLTLRDPERGLVRMPQSQSVAPDGQRLAVVTPHAVLIYSLSTLELLGRIPITGRVGGRDDKPVWSADGQRLAVVHAVGLQPPTRELVLFELPDGRELTRTRIGDEGIIGFSPEGALIAASGEGKLILRDSTTLAPVVELPGEFTTTNPAAFSPDGRYLVVGLGSKLRLWDLKRREEVTVLNLLKGSVKTLIFTPDGRKLRCVTSEGACELDLHVFDPYIAGNLAWNLERLIPALYASGGRADVERVLERVKTTNIAAYERGRAVLDQVSHP